MVRLNTTKSIRYASKAKLSLKVNIFIVPKYFFSIHKLSELTIIRIIMQTQVKFCVCVTKIDTKLFLCSELNLPSIPKFGTSSSTKKLFLWLSACDNELLSTPKIRIFLAVPLSKLQTSTISNFIHNHYTHTFLYRYFLLFFTPSKQFLNLKLLVKFLGQGSKSYTT